MSKPSAEDLYEFGHVLTLTGVSKKTIKNVDICKKGALDIYPEEKNYNCNMVRFSDYAKIIHGMAHKVMIGNKKTKMILVIRGREHRYYRRIRTKNTSFPMKDGTAREFCFPDTLYMPVSPEELISEKNSLAAETLLFHMDKIK
jgi:hypothetical protein